MLISSWFISCVLLLVHVAQCSDLQDDPSSISEKTSKQLPAETDTYGSQHPPLPEQNGEKGSQKEKSIKINEQNSSPLSSTRSRSIRQKARPKASTPTLEIPVQVIYDAETSTVPSYTSRSKSTISPLGRTTRVFARREQLRSMINKKIDIRQTRNDTSNVEITNATANTRTFSDKEKSDVLPRTEFPKRSRDSYFKKRTETPAPRVKIIEEKNFVYAHSGNFHYSFLGGDGTMVSSQGSLKSYDNNKTGEAVSGSVFYKDMDGNDYSLSYTADENGYRPVGAHLPTPPPLPPAIARALKYIADKSTQSPLDKNE